MKFSFKSLLGFLLIIALFSSCERAETDQPVTEEIDTLSAGSFSMKVNGELWEADSAKIVVARLDGKEMNRRAYVRISAFRTVNGVEERISLTRSVSIEKLKEPIGEFIIDYVAPSDASLFFVSRSASNANLLKPTIGRGSFTINKFKVYAQTDVDGEELEVKGYNLLEGTFEAKMYDNAFVSAGIEDPKVELTITEGKFSITGVPAYLGKDR